MQIRCCRRLICATTVLLSATPFFSVSLASSHTDHWHEALGVRGDEQHVRRSTGFAAGVVRTATPPQGWRSWNWFMCNITQDIMTAQVWCELTNRPYASFHLQCTRVPLSCNQCTDDLTRKVQWQHADHLPAQYDCIHAVSGQARRCLLAGTSFLPRGALTHLHAYGKVVPDQQQAPPSHHLWPLVSAIASVPTPTSLALRISPHVRFCCSRLTVAIAS